MRIRADVNEISNAIDFIRERLREKKIPSKEIAQTTLRAEEIFAAMIEHIDNKTDKIDVLVTSFVGTVEVRLISRGSVFEISELEEKLQLMDEDADDRTADVMRSFMNRVLGSGISIKNIRGMNTASIQVSKSKYRQLMLTLIALVAGLITGLILDYLCPEAVASFCMKNIFNPVNTMFLNALKAIIAPLVLFSIASSISDYGDMKSLGRIAGKILGLYFVTSLIAIVVGTITWYIFPIGNPGLKTMITDAADVTVAKGQGVSTSVVDTIVGIIPSEMINPIMNMNMLQIIFMAAMIGIATGAISEKLYFFKGFLSDGYLVCSKITTLIISVMPIAIFCAMAKMVIAMELETLLSVFTWVPTIYFGDLLMLAVYAILILVFARVNPITFFRKYYSVMIAGFTICSSNAVLPTAMEVCDKELGISKKIYSFSLPLGATINMDGSCITQMISAMFMAKIFGIPVTASVILQLALAIFILSVGAPGVPGGALVCISLLLPQIGIPADAISIIMGLYSLVSMMQTATNVTGDGAVTLIVAGSEKLLDTKTYSKDNG